MPSQFPSRLRRGAATGAAAALIGTAGAVFAVPAATASPLDGLNGFSGLGTVEIPSLSGISGTTMGEPKLELSKSDDIADGEVISITGTGYTANENIYVTQTIEKPSSGYPTTYADAVKVTADDSGSFSTELPANTSFGDVDCTSTQCYIASFTAFPKLTDRSQDAWVPINFAAGSSSASTYSTNSAAAAGSQSAGHTQGAGSSNGAASVKLSSSTGLNPDGDTITVSGSGFSTSGNGIYVGIAQQDQFTTTDSDSFDPDTVWVSTSRGNLNSDGSFSISLPVTAKFGNANCLENNCAVYTFAAHGSSDRSQDTATPVSFAGGVQNDSDAFIPAAATSGGSGMSGGGASNRASGSESDTSTGTASVSLSTTDLAKSGTTSITISGSGFKTSGNGVYVGVAEKDRYSTTNADVYSVVNFVRTSEISSDGSFSTTLSVPTVSDVANCLENQCAVYTFAAHGSSDRSQDTATDISVPGSTPSQDGASEGESTASGSASATGSTPGSADEEIMTAQVSEASTMNPVLAGGIGAIFGAALLGVGIVVGRKMGSSD